MSLEDDEIIVSRTLREMVMAGRSPAPPLTARELRMRSGRRSFPRVDGKIVVAVAAAVVLIVISFTAGPFRHQPRPGTSDAPSGQSGWIAHSAYGLQISVPKTWSVQVFGQCPDRKKPGTLFIGTSQIVDLCPEYGSSTSTVAISEGISSDSGSGLHSRFTHLRVNGIAVESIPSRDGELWTVPGKDVTIVGSGPHASAAMRTLSRATRHAIPASGRVTGTAYLETVRQLPITGQVSVERLHSSKQTSVSVIDGQFWFFGSPGRYLLTGHDGNASCAPVSVVLVSGTNVTAPSIQCEGF
jgi:hypothetical protein